MMQQWVIVPFYFKYPLFGVDWAFFKSYFWKSPYKICRSHFKLLAKEGGIYGETWPITCFRLARLLNLSESDCLYELGCGTGRASFWFSAISGCRVKAFDLVTVFIENARKIADKLDRKNIEFIEADFLDADFDEATIIYFYSSSFSNKIVEKLLNRFESLKPKTRIITTSFSLASMSQSYALLGSFRVSYPWGDCHLFIQEKL